MNEVAMGPVVQAGIYPSDAEELGVIELFAHQEELDRTNRF